MTFNQIITDLTQTIGLKGKQETIIKIIKSSLLVVALLLIGLGSYFGYRWYVISREQSAQKILGAYIQEFQKAMRIDSNQEWSDIASTFKLGFDHNTGTKTGVYFLGFQADALARQGKRAQAVEVLDTMITNLGSSSVASFFKLKRALLKLDIKDEAVVSQGLQELMALANDAKNDNRDVAQFYLGEYYWSQGNMNGAKEAWQELIAQAQESKQPSSPWATLAEQKLSQIP